MKYLLAGSMLLLSISTFGNSTKSNFNEVTPSKKGDFDLSEYIKPETAQSSNSMEPTGGLLTTSEENKNFDSITFECTKDRTNCNYVLRVKEDNPWHSNSKQYQFEINFNPMRLKKEMNSYYKKQFSYVTAWSANRLVNGYDVSDWFEADGVNIMVYPMVLVYWIIHTAVVTPQVVASIPVDAIIYPFRQKILRKNTKLLTNYLVEEKYKNTTKIISAKKFYALFNAFAEITHNISIRDAIIVAKH